VSTRATEDAASGDAAQQPVRARGLVKRYKEVLAVDSIDLNVDAGDVYGFLGPNGAGKTTTLRMCLGLIMPSGGNVQLFGRDPLREGAAALEGVAGFVEAPRFYPYLTGRKNLELLAALDGDGARTRVEEVLETVELAPRGKHRVGGYSHGMRQRLGIAAALLRAPRLLILDEPATGLDPAGMRDMRALIRRLAGEGMTVLLSSHQLPEVQELCDRVAIVDRGRVVYEGALADLRRRGGAGYRLHTTDDAKALAIVQAQQGVTRASSGEHGLSFEAQERDVGALTPALAVQGVGILALTPELATLEDLFFRLTEGGEGLDLDGGRGPTPGREPASAVGALASVGGTPAGDGGGE
jgi:ABC-2 type transport system ATP-binding protein